MAEEQTQQEDGGGVATAQDTLTVTDNRTGETYEVEITDGTVKAMDFRQMKVSEDDFGLMTYDPAFTNTASCRSSITFIDGEAGVLEHRGYPIEQLCEQVHLPRGRLPPDLRRAAHQGPARHVGPRDHPPHLRPREHQEVRGGLPLRRPPDGDAARHVGALSTFYPAAKDIDDEMERHMAAVRLIAKVPTLAAFAYRHNLGLPVHLSGQRPVATPATSSR